MLKLLSCLRSIVPGDQTVSIASSICTEADVRLANTRPNSPEVLQILNPLKETDSDTSGVGVDIRKDSDASLPQNLVSLKHKKEEKASAAECQKRVTMQVLGMLRKILTKP